MSKTTNRDNDGKPQLSYIFEFEDAIDEVCHVSEMGAKKYSRGNWKLGGPATEIHSLLDSALRHIAAIARGETRDPESGRLHAAHAAWNLLAVAYWTLRREREKSND